MRHFGRHRIRTPEQPKQIIKKEEVLENKGTTIDSPISSNSDKTNENEKSDISTNNKAVITHEVEPELIIPPTKTKIYDRVALIGNTIECRDFRAIVKKRGEQMNHTLIKIIHDWNTANYNL